MKKYTIESYYTCTFKIIHQLDDINEKKLRDIDESPEGKVEVIDVKLNNRKTKKLGGKTDNQKKEIDNKKTLTDNIVNQIKVKKDFSENNQINPC